MSEKPSATPLRCEHLGSILTPPHTPPTPETRRYRCTSLIRKCRPLGPYTRTMPRDIWWPQGRVRFLMGAIPPVLLALSQPIRLTNAESPSVFPLQG